MCNKGKGVQALFVKLMSWYDEKAKKIKIRCLGIETEGNTSEDATKAINHQLKLFVCTRKQNDNSPDQIVFDSSCTDAGGGGVGELLVLQLRLVGNVVNDINFVWDTCTLHALNLMLSVPVDKIMGAGG